ncbi:DUF2000 family protein [Streptomyces sp. NPDC004658]|uniref:DUF2000 family protein n=1 Tax=Streptomyces sp. NPDC004658 TaxID=3154672 RepID=UPI0033BEC025
MKPGRPWGRRAGQRLPPARDSDEAYVVGLRNRILGESALAQHKFDWLPGDPGAGGLRVTLHLLGAELKDADGRTHTGTYTTGLPVLRADREELGRICAPAVERGLGLCEFPAVARTTNSYDDLTEPVAPLPTESWSGPPSRCTAPARTSTASRAACCCAERRGRSACVTRPASAARPMPRPRARQWSVVSPVSMAALAGTVVAGRGPDGRCCGRTVARSARTASGERRKRPERGSCRWPRSTRCRGRQPPITMTRQPSGDRFPIAQRLRDPRHQWHAMPLAAPFDRHLGIACGALVASLPLVDVPVTKSGDADARRAGTRAEHEQPRHGSLGTGSVPWRLRAVRHQRPLLPEVEREALSGPRNGAVARQRRFHIRVLRAPDDIEATVLQSKTNNAAFRRRGHLFLDTSSQK